MTKILVFDNYDSFTYNLVHLLEKILHIKVDVFRNDEIELGAVKKYDRILLSPGPGLPSEAGLLIPLIKEYAATKKILGICLGHQAIGEAFGAKLLNLDSVFHGIASPVNILQPHSPLFDGLSEVEIVGRYHSWVISGKEFPAALEVTATDENNNIMGLRHRQYDVEGVQFHPESVLTPCGETLVRNWLKT